jgi:hypothetical protein
MLPLLQDPHPTTEDLYQLEVGVIVDTQPDVEPRRQQVFSIKIIKWTSPSMTSKNIH